MMHCENNNLVLKLNNFFDTHNYSSRDFRSFVEQSIYNINLLANHIFTDCFDKIAADKKLSNIKFSKILSCAPRELEIIQQLVLEINGITFYPKVAFPGELENCEHLEMRLLPDNSRHNPTNYVLNLVVGPKALDNIIEKMEKINSLTNNSQHSH